MNDHQMAMLSVKSAIERVIQGLITAYELTGTSKQFFSGVERLVASFFVSGQIDNNHLVRSTQSGDLEIRFSTGGQYTCLTIMLPKRLQWKVEINSKKPVETIKKVVAGDTRIDSNSGKIFVFNGSCWVVVPEKTAGTDVRGEICKIVSKMLDQPHAARGIYGAGECADDLTVFAMSLLSTKSVGLVDEVLRTNVCNSALFIIQKMLNRPDKCGIYPTAWCYTALENLISDYIHGTNTVPLEMNGTNDEAEKPTDTHMRWPFPTGKLESPGVPETHYGVDDITGELRTVSANQAYDGDVQADINDDEKAIRAYEKAKKFVEGM